MTQELDQAREKFAGKMLGILNDAALAYMVSIGHRTSLFDVMANLPPSTSEQIAAAANLNERYVREWLGAMVTGRIVDFDPVNGTYHLSPEHAAFLTRAVRSDNLAMFAQYFALMGQVEDRIVECFYRGGGVPYSAYPKFQQLMAEESNQTVVAALVDSMLPLVPGLIEKLRTGTEALDVGCGRGHAVNVMAAEFPDSRFTGYDFSEEGVTAGRAEAQQMGLANVCFEVKDVATLDEPERYGLITAFDAIHDQAHPTKVLRGIADALRPGGTFLMQDIRASSHVEKNLDNPLASFLYTASVMHCMTVSLALNGEGLGTMWGEEKARQMLTEAGFSCLEVRQLPHDIQNSYYIATKS